MGAIFLWVFLAVNGDEIVKREKVSEAGINRREEWKREKERRYEGWYEEKRECRKRASRAS